MNGILYVFRFVTFVVQFLDRLMRHDVCCEVCGNLRDG